MHADNDTPDIPETAAAEADAQQQLLGDHFAPAQSGSAWTSAARSCSASRAARAAAAPGGFEAGQVQLGANEQEYKPSDAELVAAEAGDRLSAALQGADEAPA